ncbi:bifunctional diguanylate cyclase/phosphodiesterase [Ruminococcus sp.]|uniref:putative bifunctional diguanylate cyclase/phosphodiesterase n=1 Tax=Ruminococcus sp. TaxID=41978 RepID=UPI0025ED978B|nr:GGDEF and EAL domain-containing protein [Ruminococcus sp.]MCR4639628.1 EAL domain-containing protein [Ruminococcus sp.]
MRSIFSILFSLLILALAASSIIARRSHKPIGKAVALFEASILTPVLGNLLIVASSHRMIALTGCYLFFLGFDMVMFSLINFTNKYCNGVGEGQKPPKFIYVLLIFDAVQILLNPIFGHAFGIENITVDGLAYYRFVPQTGLMFHRILDYGIITAILLIYVIAVKRAPKIYSEKYLLIMLSLITLGIWQTFYILSRKPVDTSMMGFGILGLVIFYFALYYRPLMLLDRMLSGIASEMSEAMFIFDATGTCIWANEQGLILTELPADRIDEASDKLTELFGPLTDNSANRCIMGIGSDAKYYTLEESRAVDNQKLSGTYLRIRDVTEERQKLKREMYDTTHDLMTGLYTREYLYQRIFEIISANPDKKYRIVYVDVKNFKVVNDIFGTKFGDNAIIHIADWIRQYVPKSGCYGRLAGDTFGVCIPKEDFDADFLEDTLSHFTIKSERAEYGYHLLIHIGVYDADSEDTSDISLMFDRAHLALSNIRDEFKTHIAYYDNDIREKLLWDQEISSQVYNAVATGQLRPYLQPIADKTGRIVGAEALVRWIHPTHGFLSPGAFIPVFEKNGMIIEVDKHMWRCACKILSRWQSEDSDLFISVNISPKDFYFVDVVAEIKKLTEEFRLNPSKLRIEITETVMMNDAENRMALLDELRKSGFIVEMDDFGSGYSSLNMLKDMPVDVLKIDMKFLGKSSDSEKAQTIVKNIINLTKELGIISLTEGVETPEQYEALEKMGCNLFQGYYFAKPMPVNDFEDFIASRSKHEENE